eukprot:tig00020902_g14941.t1
MSRHFDLLAQWKGSRLAERTGASASAVLQMRHSRSAEDRRLDLVLCVKNELEAASTPLRAGAGAAADATGSGVQILKRAFVHGSGHGTHGQRRQSRGLLDSLAFSDGLDSLAFSDGAGAGALEDSDPEPWSRNQTAVGPRELEGAAAGATGGRGVGLSVGDGFGFAVDPPDLPSACNSPGPGAATLL